MGYKERLLDIDNGYVDASKEDKLFYFQEDEVGLHHWLNRSVIRICDDGCIDSFVGDTIGIRLDPNTQSVNSFGPKINLFGNRINFLTNPNGLIWNHWQFNPRFYELCEDIPKVRRNFRVSCTMEVWDDEDQEWVTRSASLPPYFKDRTPDTYSPQVKKVLQDLGLPL